MLLEIDAIVQIIDIAVGANHWKDVLRLTKAVEGSLALSKRWSLWEQVLLRGLQASQAEQDPVAEAWALHQLGTRALCLEANASGTSYLTKAIQIRESLGDKMGISATRHNLNLIQSLPQTHTKSYSTVETYSEKHFSKETEIETSRDLVSNHFDSSQYLLTRMNIVMEDVLPLDQPFYKSILLSPKGIITTGILASGGLLAWFNYHRFLPKPSMPSISVPTKTVTPSPVIKHKPTIKTTPSPIAEPIYIPTAALGPIVEPLPKIDPPLKPAFNLEIPRYKASNSNKSKSKPKSILLPTATPAPELTPTPTFTPTETATPNQEF